MLVFDKFDWKKTFKNDLEDELTFILNSFELPLLRSTDVRKQVTLNSRYLTNLNGRRRP